MKNLTLIILTVLVIFNQIAILGPILQRGLMPEDWDILLGYKVEQERRPFFPERIKHIWETQDKLYKNQIIYIGIFNDLLGLNRTAYILANIVLKIAATLSIYLLLVTLFKNRLLAATTSFFFSISPSVAGSLAYIVTGDDYLSLIFMSFFAISYFYLLKKGGSRLPASILLTLAIVSSPLRMHPFLVLPIFIEAFLFIKKFLEFRFSKETLHALKVSTKRLIIFFLPIYLLYLGSMTGEFKVGETLVSIIDQIKQGNWHVLLPPLFSMGFTITDNNTLIALASMFSNTVSLGHITLLGRLVIIFFFITILTTSFVTWLIKPKNPIIFFAGIFFTTNILNFLIFLSVQNINNILFSFRAPFNETNVLVTLAGGYYLILGVAIFLEWFFHQRKEKILALFPLSVFWTFIFSVFTWLEVGSGLSFGDPIHRYLTFASLGTSLFTALIVVLFIDKLKKVENKNLKFTLGFLATAALIFIYLHQITFITNYFNEENGSRERSGIRQEMLKARFSQALGKIDPATPALIYIELGQNKNVLPDYENTFFAPIMHTIFYSPDNKIIPSCRTFIYGDYAQVLKIAKVENSQIKFVADSRCLDRDGRYGPVITYPTDNFYAFSLIDDNFSNIKQAVVDKLKSDLQ